MPSSEALEREAAGRASGRPPAEMHAAHGSIRRISLMRASVGERLGLCAAVLVLLWGAVFWALQ